MESRVGTRAVVAWVAGWLILAGAAGLYSISTAAKDAEPRSLIAQGRNSAQLDGVTVRVTEMTITSSRTTVRVVVAGQPDAGTTVNLLDRAELVLEDGARFKERAGRADGREITLDFPALPIPADTGPIVLDLKGLALSHEPAGVARQMDRNFVGRFMVETSPGMRRISRGVIREVGLTTAFGEGALAVATVIQGESETVIRGRLIGFDAGLIPEIALGRAQLTDESGAVFGMVEGRSGFGEGLADVELRFEHTSGPVLLLVPLDVPGLADPRTAHDTQAVSRLAGMAGSTASMRLDLEP